VIRGPYPFYHGTYAVEIQHPPFIARYCEISRAAPGLQLGTRVTEGQVIAYVGRLHVDSMLHFEIYSGRANGPLTQRNNPPYQRRADLLDPTPFLDSASVRLTP
jgi:murein DD-endopeptidase MepM/ murein hydrolase activator NlpD